MSETKLTATRYLPTPWLVPATLFALALVHPAHATDCASPNPADWPASRKPYVMIIADTSSSMTLNVGTSNTCGYPSDRRGHLRCALKNLFMQRGDQVNFGLATYAMTQQSCAGSCFTSCAYGCFPEESATTGQCLGCGPKPGNATTRAGAFIRVPVPSEPASPPSNLPDLLAWVDNACGDSVELFASGTGTPLNGTLRDMKRYFENQWTAPDGSISYASPISTDPAESCRPVRVILISDGDETCDTNTDAVLAAQNLYFNVNVGGINYPVRTNVINFAGGSQPQLDQIALAGGTSSAYFAANATQLLSALLFIVDDVTPALRFESCGNSFDENCNGCLNESTLVANAGDDRVICPNTPTVISGSHAGAVGPFINYQWTTTGGTLTNANQASATFSAPPGVYELTFAVRDLSSNCPRQDSVTVTVEDTTPPSILACPANITVPPETSACEATVSWTPPTAQDNCGSAGLVGSHSPGDLFAMGVTTVTYVATDSTGNQAMCSFDVTVAAFPDLDEDGFVTLNEDAPILIDVLFGLDTTPIRLLRADTNCDGLNNGLDIQGFVDALLP